MTKYSTKQQFAVEALERAKGGGEYRRTYCGLCEATTGEINHTSFWIHVPTAFFGCWAGCGCKGRLPGYEDEDSAGYEPPPPPDLGAPGLQAPDGFVTLDADEYWLPPHRRYVTGRGISREVAVAAGLGATTTGKYRGRVIVPIRAATGKHWLGFAARLIRKPQTFTTDDGQERTELRYKYPPGNWRNGVVFNSAALLVETDEPALGVEGTFSALPHWPDCFAFLGQPMASQFDVVVAAKRPLAICLDGDAWLAGRMFAAKLQLEGRRDVGFVKLPPKTDPNDARDWLREEARRCIGKPIF